MVNLSPWVFDFLSFFVCRGLRYWASRSDHVYFIILMLRGQCSLVISHTSIVLGPWCLAASSSIWSKIICSASVGSSIFIVFLLAMSPSCSQTVLGLARNKLNISRYWHPRLVMPTSSQSHNQRGVAQRLCCYLWLIPDDIMSKPLAGLVQLDRWQTLEINRVW